MPKRTTASYLTPILVSAAYGSEAGPVGTLLGVAIAATFATGEYIYDNKEVIISPIKEKIRGLSSLESFLRSMTPYSHQ